METACKGIAMFPSMPGDSFAYKLLCDEGCVMVWLQDRATYAEWESRSFEPYDDALAFDIPRVSPSLEDYISILQSCLEEDPSNEKSEALRGLTRLDDGSLVLELAPVVRIFSVVSRPRVRLNLLPVVREPLQAAFTRVRDLELRLKAIEVDRERERAARVNQRVLFLENAEVFQRVQVGERLRWKPRAFDVGSEHFDVREDGAVAFRTAGTFVISVDIQHSPHASSAAGLFQLTGRGGWDARTVASGNSTFLTHTVFVETSEVACVERKVATMVFEGTTLAVTPLYK